MIIPCSFEFGYTTIVTDVLDIGWQIIEKCSCSVSEAVMP